VFWFAKRTYLADIQQVSAQARGAPLQATQVPA
jgi:hypothetical protein